MKSFNEYKSGENIGLFFGKLMAARQQAHILHLGTRSYAEHVALGSFYDELVELLDTFIETYQGQYGLVTVESADYKEKNPQDFMTTVAKDFKEAHKMVKEEDTHLHNILDEMTGLAYQTLYKLKFLK